MSVSTECSFRTESDWEPPSGSTSMINLDMTQPYDPTSPHKFKVGSVSSFLTNHPRTLLLMSFKS